MCKPLAFCAFVVPQDLRLLHENVQKGKDSMGNSKVLLKFLANKWQASFLLAFISDSLWGQIISSHLIQRQQGSLYDIQFLSRKTGQNPYIFVSVCFLKCYKEYLKNSIGKDNVTKLVKHVFVLTGTIYQFVLTI